jgi:hypothetical protein
MTKSQVAAKSIRGQGADEEEVRKKNRVRVRKCWPPSHHSRVFVNIEAFT